MYALLIGQFPYIPAQISAKAMKAAINVGVPFPSFKSATLDVKTSEEAVCLLRMLLCRDPNQRPNAEEAVLNPWFSMRSWNGSGQQSPPSLRAALSCAKRVGAFDVRNGVSVERNDAVDTELRE